jgi:hypothetical protein
MKKFIFTFPLIILLVIAIGGFYSFNNDSVNEPQKKDSQHTATNPKIEKISDVINARKMTQKFDEIRIFNLDKSGYGKYGLNKSFRKAEVLNLKKNKLSEIINSAPENIILTIPVSDNKLLKFELYKENIFAKDFKVNIINSSGVQSVEVFPGIHYRGIIRGDNNSLASFSFYKDRISGVFSDKKGNYNVGSIDRNKPDDRYIMFNDFDYNGKIPFECKVDDYNPKFTKYPSYISNSFFPQNPARRRVGICFFADYQMYLDFGSNTSTVTNYITSAFNSVSTLYQNEYLGTEIAQINVYNYSDPYINLHDSYLILTAFGGNVQNNFTGDLAQLLSTRQEGFGGIAWVRTLCENYHPDDSSGRYSFCGIDTTYMNYPLYSWTVMVMTHELGHNFGSMHTHACWWPITQYIRGAIDSCYYAEGGCFSGTTPTFNGTIMSYCHLNGGIVLMNGFGPMPGDTVRLRYNQATCFGSVINSSEYPVTFSLMQNFPNPFNPGTRIQFDVPKNALITIKIYDIAGREITKLQNSNFYTPGTYSVYFDANYYSLSSGVYLYQIIANDASSQSVIYTELKKMLMIK